MTGPLLHTWSLNLGYAKRLVADIPDDGMALQPVMAAHENMYLGQVSAWRRVQAMARV